MSPDVRSLDLSCVSCDSCGYCTQAGTVTISDNLPLIHLLAYASVCFDLIQAVQEGCFFFQEKLVNVDTCDMVSAKSAHHLGRHS